MDTEFAAPLTLEEVAARVKRNASYFSHKFRTTTGFSFREYLCSVRIRNASHQLLITDDSITKIALSCGFASSNYFKDCFKKNMGVSPREYRQRAGVSAKHGSGTAS